MIRSRRSLSFAVSVAVAAIFFLPAAQAFAQNPIPFVNTPLLPTAVAPGSTEFTLTVNGAGFVSSSVVNWNGTALITTFVSSRQLTAVVPAANVAVAGTATVTVSSPMPGGGPSNFLYFSITNPATPTFFSYSVDVGMTPIPIVAADFNGDGKPDLAVLDQSEPDPACFSFFKQGMGKITILLGNGDGTFSSSSLCLHDELGASGLPQLIAADINGDGKIDLIAKENVAFNDTQEFVLYYGQGDGTFSPPTVLSSGQGVGSLAIGDFDGDGKMDFAFPLVGSPFPYVEAFFGNGMSGGFTAGGGPRTILVPGDFNNDGILDLLTSESGGLAIGKGDGTFALSPFTLPVNVLRAADLNGDGNLDFLAGAQVSLGDGNGNFTAVPGKSAFPAGNDAVFADINGDGKLDLVIADASQNHDSVYLGNGDGKFQSGLSETFGTGSSGIAVADFNGDGRLDIAVANANDNTVTILVQPGNSSPVAAFNSNSLLFPNQLFNTTSSPQQITLSNLGGVPLDLSGVTVTGDFQLQSNPCTTVQPGASCKLSFGFTPSALGTRMGTATLADNAANAPQTLNLLGVGSTTTTTALMTSKTHSLYSEPVVLTATVVPSVAANVTGSVSFFDNASSVPIATVRLSNGTATASVSTLPHGTNSITASYLGDGSFNGLAGVFQPSTSAAVMDTVSGSPIDSISLFTERNNYAVGDPVAFYVTLSDDPAAFLTGTVTVKTAERVLGTAPLNGNNAVVINAVFPQAGTLNVVAYYSGDQTYPAIKTVPTQYIVSRNCSSTSLSSSSNPSTFGQPVVFTANVSRCGPPVTGEVIFKKNGNTVLGQATAVNGVATLSKSHLPKGTFSVTATYNENRSTDASTSAPIVQVVQ